MSDPRRAAAALLLALAGCGGFDRYQAWRVRNGCLALDRCAVYDAAGKHEVPCISTNHGAIYPGDPGWPFQPPDVCDGVLAAERARGAAP